MEWYVEIKVHFPAPLDPLGDYYADLADDFYDALSEYLGAGEFTSTMGLCADGPETYIYVDAQGPREAGRLARAMFGEASERVWGAGTTVEITKVITDEERDLELDRELGIYDWIRVGEFAVAIEPPEWTGSNYAAYSPDLPGCVATGKTREEVEHSMREAIELHLEGLNGR